MIDEECYLTWIHRERICGRSTNLP